MTEFEKERLYETAVNFIFASGKFDDDYLKKALQIGDDDYQELLSKLKINGAITEKDAAGNYYPDKKYIHSEYLLKKELIQDGEKDQENAKKKAGKKIDIAFLCVAAISFVIICYYSSREIISLAITVPTFIFGFWLVDKAGGGAKIATILTVCVCVGLLFWVDSQTPIFGERYSLRMEREAISERARKEEIYNEKQRVLKTMAAKDSVKSSLKDASSAQFSGDFQGKNDSVCGYVNAKNSFGAYAGKTRYVSANGVSSIDDGSEGFASRWNDACSK
ncbi:hypothetical protein [Atlantibacter sp. RC6]|uniref:hypothetical protein n=1 Tax=Atlantibacter sp. RC6 TaxID=2587036 RepID=UPI0016063B2B|nr:hypothetical protein [Atlantibacter sp. RC6]MBB3320901.1 hypothetical protein [Atlantibacter sp. RC6]